MSFGSAYASSPRGFGCGAGGGADGTPVYRPRHPERTAFYRVVHEHLDRYLGACEDRFEPRQGPLRSVVPRAAEAFLECGRLLNGFARIRFERDHLERLARYDLRAPISFERVTLAETGQVEVATPPHPRTGEERVVLDSLDFLHALARQVPQPRQHAVRYYGAHANRSRRLWHARWDSADGGPDPVGASPDPSPDTPRDAADPAATGPPGSRRANWARLLRRILEVDPLLCPRCLVEMVVISVITDPRVVERILEHHRRGRGRDPFAERAPPGPTGLERTETPH